jgi:hypothetical protein
VCKPSKDTDQTAVHSTVTPTAAKSLTVDDSSEVDENQVSFLLRGVNFETSYWRQPYPFSLQNGTQRMAPDGDLQDYTIMN